MSLIFGSGGGLSPEQAEKVDIWSYDPLTRRLSAEASIQSLPSSFYMGANFRMSNGVSGVAFKLADGRDAIGVVNRYDPTDGSRSNPSFYALGASSMLTVEGASGNVISAPFELQYQTAGDNLTYDFEFVPATAGTFHAQYWLGTDDTGSLIFDEQRQVTQAEVDAGLPIMFEVGNPYLLPANTDLFVRFDGIDFKGGASLPYFKSKIMPYTEIGINGHTLPMVAGTQIFIGCTYIPTTGDYTKTIPANFTSDFEIKDLNNVISNSSRITVDFGAQGSVILKHSGDHVKFNYIKDDGWYFEDIKGLSGGRV